MLYAYISVLTAEWLVLFEVVETETETIDAAAKCFPNSDPGRLIAEFSEVTVLGPVMLLLMAAEYCNNEWQSPSKFSHGNLFLHL